MNKIIKIFLCIGIFLLMVDVSIIIYGIATGTTKGLGGIIMSLLLMIISMISLYNSYKN